MQMQLRNKNNRVGIIGGTNLFDTGLMTGCSEEELKTKYGAVCLFISPEFVFILRHGRYRNIPPHRINHRANIMAFKVLGIDRIIGVTSVGSLKKEIKPGSLLVPHDYISLCNIPTFFDDEIVVKEKHQQLCMSVPIAYAVEREWSILKRRMQR